VTPALPCRAHVCRGVHVPGVVTQGETFEEALDNARDALETMLDLSKEGDPLPKASEPQQLSRKIVKSGAIPAPIQAELSVPMARVNISIEQPLLERIDRAASAAGQTRSGFLASAARAALRGTKEGKKTRAVA
jgi:predicted RNase H-like HicB family nuclease